MTNTIHLNTKQTFRVNPKQPISEKILNSFLESCLQLDVSIFEPYMNEDDVFEDKEKYLFLHQLYEMFEELRKDTLDDFRVDLENTVCKGCSKGKKVKQFKVFNEETKMKIYEFSFLIDIQDGVLFDIYRCYDYIGCETTCFQFAGRNIPISKPLLMKIRENP